MNEPNQSNIQLKVMEDQYSVSPGEKIDIPVVLVNQAQQPEQVRISVEGIPLFWVSTEQQVILVQPGVKSLITLTVQPPGPPNAPIGRYQMRVLSTSVLDPTRTAQAQVSLTVAKVEVKGRIGVLLESLQFSVTPGDQLGIRLVLINQGLAADTFRVITDGLPENWVAFPPVLALDPEEVIEAVIRVKPPRDSSARATRYPFSILVASKNAPAQNVTVSCTLMVTAFTEFKSDLEAALPDQNLPAQVLIQNLSNIPTTFQITWHNPEDALVFEPNEPHKINLAIDEVAKVPYTTRPARRSLIGSEKVLPYTVAVNNVAAQESDQQTQVLESNVRTSGRLPVWAAVLCILFLCICMFVGGTRIFFPGAVSPESATPTPTNTAAVPVPTATQSAVDQAPLLREVNWFLVGFNDTGSSPGVQEPFTRFNPDGTLIGYTGCKNLSGSYQTNFNQISITNVNLEPGTCANSNLQQQETAMIDILRSARSYFIANTAMQLAGDSGFLNYSQTPVIRAEDNTPPQPVIRAVIQSQVGQVVIFDGTASTGQVPLISWQWDFGDGTRASGVVVQHIYNAAGTFNVRLTVTDQRNQTGTTSQQIHILPLPTPTMLPVPPTLTPLPVLPTATPAPPEQPTATTQPTPEPKPTATPEPLPLPPQASISGPGQGYIGEPVNFTASASQPGSSPISSYRWILGNGKEAPSSPYPNLSAIYNRAGNYEVTVIVTDASGLSSYATTHVNIDARLDTTVWTLSAINNRPIVPGTAITMQFLNGEIVGFTGCNTYSGGYTAQDNGDGTYTIALSQLTVSRLMCPVDVMDQESAYLKALQQATSAAIRENQSVLESPTDQLVFYLIEPD